MGAYVYEDNELRSGPGIGGVAPRRPEATADAARLAAVDAWFVVYDAYHKASGIYNARVKFIREQEAAGCSFGTFNAHGEYKMLNEAQRATYTAAETLYAALKSIG